MRGGEGVVIWDVSATAPERARRATVKDEMYLEDFRGVTGSEYPPAP